jgi:hypothetical protein
MSRASPGPQQATERPVTGVQVDADLHRRRAGRGGRGLLDQVEVVPAVHHQGDRPGRRRGTGQPGQRRAVRGRIGNHDVVGGALVSQPQCLGQAEG